MSLYYTALLQAITDNRTPSHAHVLWDDETYGLWMVDTASKRYLYKSLDEGVTWTQIYDGGGATYEIMIFHPDLTNSRLLIGVIETGQHDFGLIEIDLTDDSDNSLLQSIIHDIYGLDIGFFDDGEYGVYYYENIGGNYVLYVDGGLAFNHSQDMGSAAGRTVKTSYFEKVGDDLWFLWNWSNENVELWKYDHSAGSFTQMQDLGANSIIPDDHDLRGISYDGTDYLYFIVEDTVASKNYLWAYSISLDTITQLDEFNVALMLNRMNTATGVFFDTEKGFGKGATNYRMLYQIPSSFLGYLYKIGDLTSISDLSGYSISGVTDHYVILDNGSTSYICEFMNANQYIIEPWITHRVRDYPWAKIEYESENVKWEKDMFVQIIDSYTSKSISDDLEYPGFITWESVTMTAEKYWNSPDPFNNETPGSILSAAGMAFIDTLYIPNSCTCSLEEIDNHYNTLKLTHDGGADDPYIVHDFPNGAETSGSREFWWGTSDNARVQRIHFRDSGNANRIILSIRVGTYQYHNGIDWQDTSIGVTNGQLDHHRIDFDCTTDTFDWYINGAKIVDGGNFYAISNNIDNIFFTILDNVACSMYVDAWGDPNDADYSAGYNLNPYDISELLDAGYSLYCAHDSYIKINSLVDGHENVLELYDGTTTKDDGNDEVGLIVDFSASQTSGTVEITVHGDDVTDILNIILLEDTTNAVTIKIDADKLQYYYSAGWHDATGGALSNDTMYHLRIVFDNSTDTYSVYLDCDLLDSGIAYENAVTNINTLKIVTGSTASAYTYYLDTIDFSWESGYYSERSFKRTKANEVIFEGYILSIEDKEDTSTKTKVAFIVSPALFDLINYYPNTSVSAGDTDEHLIELLASCNYLQPGTIADGGALNNTIYNGGISFGMLLVQWGAFDQHQIYSTPKGYVQKNAGDLDNGVNFDQTTVHECFVEKRQIRYNKIIVKGGRVNGVQIEGDPQQDIELQQESNIKTLDLTIPWIDLKTDAETMGASILALLKTDPIFAEIHVQDKNARYGFIQPGEEITFSFSVKGITEAQFKVDQVEYNYKSKVLILNISSVLRYDVDDFKEKSAETLDEQLTQIMSAMIATRDLWIPSSALGVPSSNPAAWVDHGISGAWEFGDEAVNMERIITNIKLPEDMDLTVAPSIVLKWSSTTTSANCYWQVEYLYRALNEDTTGAADDTLQSAKGSSSVAEGLVSSSFTLAVPSSTDLMLYLRITRRSDDALDTINGDTVELQGISFNYTSNKRGS